MSRGGFVRWGGCALAALAACRSGTAPPNDVPTSLVEAALDLDGASSQSACDDQARAARRRVADAVDAREADAAAYAASLPDAGRYRRVRLGPTFVRELIELPTNPPGTALTRAETWADLDATRARLGDQPVGEAWLDLDSRARFLMTDDWHRTIQRLSAIGTDPAKPPDAVFTKNDGVRRASAESLEVELDPGPFADVRDELAAYIETVWASPSLALRVVWVDAASHPNAYRVVLDSGSGGRSFVMRSERAVHLFPDVRARSIAHEIGHVLGFADRYRTTWDESACTYVTAVEKDDLMSNADAGVVTDAEWAVLAAKYPNPTSPGST
jgi:hypothetical protein